MPNKPALEPTNLLSLSTLIELGDENISAIEALREGVIQDRGLSITKGMLSDYVQHFSDGVYGTECQVNFEHNRGGEAAGWIKRLFIQGVSLMAEVEWTELGADKIRKKLYKFVSSELAMSYPHHNTGEPVANVFIGLALTNTPALKGQVPVTLSEEEKTQLLNNQRTNAMLKQLIADLKGRALLSEADINFAKGLLADAPEADRGALKAELDSLAEKQKTQATAEAQRLAELAKTHVPLSEFNELNSKFGALNSSVEAERLETRFEKTLLLSETTKIGFTAILKEEVMKFMKSLTEEQRAQFVALVGKVKAVDTIVRGGEGVSLVEGGDREDKITALAAKMMTEGKAKDITEAQKLATAEIDKVNA